MRLWQKTGVDFRRYKVATVVRRADSRLQKTGAESYKKYLKFLENNQEEYDELLQALLVNVTGFYRDPQYYHALHEQMAELSSRKKVGQAIRVWSVGCATGEEPYSLAILLLELAGQQGVALTVQVFASDVDREAIDYARKGVFEAEKLKGLPADLLQKYFEPEGGQHFKVTSFLRRKVLFLQHNVLNSPPFIKLDIVSCRNLFIYFNREQQNELLPVFHYALNRGGLLCLGTSERINHQNQLFEVVDNDFSIYRKALLQDGSPLHFKGNFYRNRQQASAWQKLVSDTGHKELEQALSLYIDPLVIVNEKMELLEVRGNLRHYSELNTGTVNNRLVGFLRPELHTELQLAFSKAVKSQMETWTALLKLPLHAGRDKLVKLVVVPLNVPHYQQDCYAVIFKNFDEVRDLLPPRDGDDTRAVQLRQELDNAREYHFTLLKELEEARNEMLGLNEDLYNANEELRATVEELESSNEELKLLNEEMASSNTELRAVNHELEQQKKSLAVEREKLLQSEELFRQLASNAPIGIFRLNEQCQCTWVNPKLQEIGSFTFEEAMGKGFIRFIHPEDLDSVLQKLKVHVTRKRRYSVGEYRYVRKDGSERWVTTRLATIFNPAGEVSSYAGTVEDNTQKRKYQQELEYRQYLMERANSVARLGYWEWDHQSDRVTWSEEVYNIYEIPAGEQPPAYSEHSQFFDEAELAKLNHAVQLSIEENKPYDIELEAVSRKGRKIWIRAAGFPKSNHTGKVASLWGIMQDITGSKQQRLLLQERNAQLKKLNEELDRFVYSASHDLKSPLSSIMGLVSIIKMSDNLEDINLYLDKIGKSAERLNDFILELINFSRVKTQRHSPEKIDVAVLVNDRLEDLEHLVYASKITVDVKVEGNSVAYLDKPRLSIILANLLSNAIKYSHPRRVKPYVQVLIRITKTNCHFNIRDNGTGIKPEALPHIFDMFYKASEERKGSGLGLYIVKNAVESMKGTIEVASEYNVGTAFTLVLPNQLPPEEESNG
mgnify:CR=1 FL=1